MIGVINNRMQLEQKLQEINKILSNKYHQDANIGVLAGISGIALFHFYYSKYLEVDTYADIGVEILGEVVNRINEGYQFPNYSSGIAGAGWVFEHLLEVGFIDSDTDNLLADLDDYLFTAMNSEMKGGQFDFLHAGIGYAYYFLKRYQNTKVHALKARYKTYLDKMISDLEKTAEKDPNGLKWKSILDIETGLIGYNLSLSHGMSSIVIFLAKLHQIDDFKDTVIPMLTGAINYIRSHEIKHENLNYFYPSWISIPSQKDDRNRLAWCYGDLGIGLAFWKASKTLKDGELKNKALEILKHGAKKVTVDETGVIDAGVCHGSYGNAQIFNRMYKETDDPIFKEAAHYWIDFGLKMAVHEDGNAGYKKWNGIEEKWESNMSLLEGVTGIGLAIIDHIADFESSWDESLMIS